MTSFRIAWRNLARNRRRTAITLSAVALNAAVLITTLALMRGLEHDMLRAATRLFVGDIQAHAPDYLAERSFYDSLDKPEALLLAAASQQMYAAPRSYGYGRISHGSKSAGATFIGVRPDAERRAFELNQEVHTGNYLGDDARREVVIGAKLARSLQAEVGTELVAVVQAADGSLGTDLLHVAGILKSVGEEIDRGGIFLHATDFEQLFVSDGRIHEVAFNAVGRDPRLLISRLAPTDPRVDLRTWREILPSLSDMLTMYDAAIWLFALVFYIAAGLGVLNTMLMATHDRVRELGLLKALGESPWRIVRDIATEALVLGMVATAFGLAIGLLGVLYLQIAGIDLSVFGDTQFSFAGIAWDPIWRARLNLSETMVSVVLMWLACVLASLYPAIKVARLQAARAMTHV